MVTDSKFLIHCHTIGFGKLTTIVFYPNSQEGDKMGQLIQHHKFTPHIRVLLQYGSTGS